MNKAIFKQPLFYLAVGNFFLTLYFASQKGALAHTAAFIWLISASYNVYKANKATHSS